MEGWVDLGDRLYSDMVNPHTDKLNILFMPCFVTILNCFIPRIAWSVFLAVLISHGYKYDMIVIYEYGRIIVLCYVHWTICLTTH